MSPARSVPTLRAAVPVSSSSSCLPPAPAPLCSGAGLRPLPPCPIPGSASGNPQASACAAADAGELRPGICRRRESGTVGWRSAACAGSVPPARGSRTGRRPRGNRGRCRKAPDGGRRAACGGGSRSPAARAAWGRRRTEGSGSRRPRTVASGGGSSAGTWPGPARRWRRRTEPAQRPPAAAIAAAASLPSLSRQAAARFRPQTFRGGKGEAGGTQLASSRLSLPGPGSWSGVRVW